MSIRVGIVEDDAISVALIRDYLSRYEREFAETFHVTAFPDGRDIVEHYTPRFDILLLDIQMEHLDGLSTARRIREVDDQVVLIFITSAPQYAIKGYEVDALSYLLKPLPWFAFSQELKRSIAVVRRRASASLVLHTGSEVVRVNVADIVFIESIKHRLIVHTLTDQISLAGTLKSMEAELEDRDFFRSNSCYLINLAHVVRIKDQDCLMTGGDELRISRPRKRAFLQALTAHAGGAR